MQRISQKFVFLISSIAVIIFTIAIFVGFSTEPTTLLREQIFVGQIRGPHYNQDVNDYLKISEMPPNSMAWFFYPNSMDTTNRDAFEQFILIRLPEELGGNQTDLSAFRAYSALSINSHCLMIYWPQEGRKRIEDPCHGDIIRPQDGILVVNTNPIKSGIFVAQPYLKLSANSEGYLYAESPKWEMDKNGVVGIGRNISTEDIKKVAISDFENYMHQNGKNLEIPYVLSDGTIISPGMDKGQFIYSHPQDSRLQHFLELSYCNCTDQVLYDGLGSNHFQVWNLGNERVYTDEWTIGSNGFAYSKITIFREGYEIIISGSTLDKTLEVVFSNFYENKNKSMLEMVSEIRRN